MKYVWIAALAAAAEAKKQCAKTNCFKEAQAHPEQCSSFLKETLIPCSDNVDFTVTSTNTLEATTNTLYTPVTTPVTVTDTTSSTSTTTIEKSAFTTTTVYAIQVPTSTVTVTSTVYSTVQPQQYFKRHATADNLIFRRDRRGNIANDDVYLTPIATPGASCTAAIIEKASQLPEFAAACGYAGYEALSSRVVKACNKAGVEGETVTLAQGTITVTRTAMEDVTPGVEVTKAVTETKTVTVTEMIVIPETAEETITTVTNTEHSTIVIPTTTTTTALTTSIRPATQRRSCSSAENDSCSLESAWCVIRAGTDESLFIDGAVCNGDTTLGPICRTDADCVAYGEGRENYCVLDNDDNICAGGAMCGGRYEQCYAG